MTDQQVWLVTGAGRGLGTDIAKAALAAGHAVVATGRDARKVVAALGESGNLLSVKLDVTSLDDAKAAVDATLAKFGRLDVLVNKGSALRAQANAFRELSSSLGHETA
jgi:NAD(P)-dependent dehydrogenase (short-subunit alcohol dehydrogenase family)